MYRHDYEVEFGETEVSSTQKEISFTSRPLLYLSGGVSWLLTLYSLLPTFKGPSCTFILSPRVPSLFLGLPDPSRISISTFYLSVNPFYSPFQLLLPSFGLLVPGLVGSFVFRPRRQSVTSLWPEPQSLRPKPRLETVRNYCTGTIKKVSNLE